MVGSVIAQNLPKRLYETGVLLVGIKNASFALISVVSVVIWQPHYEMHVC